MSNQSPNTLESLFEAAVHLKSAEERTAFLDESCSGDAKLRRTVEALLRSHEQAGSFLNPPGGGVEAALGAGLARVFDEDEAIVLGSAGHSVLKQIGETIDVPRVVLRDSEAQVAEPIQRPTSPEIPARQDDSRYQLQGEIARGGMGAIIKGRDTDLGRDLAIKVLLEEHKAKPEVIQRFVEEAQIGGQLQHPGIAPVYELGQFSDKRPFFSMKLIKGKTLSKLLGARKNPAEERGRFLGIFEQVCQTMAYAHSRGVIHRDLKPANIMVGAFGEVQVMDWGLAKVLPAGGVADEKEARDTQMHASIIQTLRSIGSDAPGTFGSVGSQTQMGSVMGTPAYMPPEQALGEIDNLDERSDVFGLGAILCEILTGQAPYVAEDGKDVIRLASRGKLEDCFKRLDACEADPELIAIAKGCLELEPVDRPRDAGELAAQVTGYLESVEAKLRKSEVERATEAARAEEAIKTVAAAEAKVKAERRARRLQLSLATGLILVATIGGLAAVLTAKYQGKLRRIADNEKKIAQEATAESKRANTEIEQNLYYANMLTAGHVANVKDGLSRVAELTDEWLPKRNQSNDLRGWEWYYLKSQLLQAEQSFSNAVGMWEGDQLRLTKAKVDGSFSVYDADDRVLGAVPPNSLSKGCSVSTNVEHMRAAILHRNGLLVIWDLKAKAELFSFQSHDTSLSSSDLGDREVRVILSPNSEQVATWFENTHEGSLNGTLKIWNLSTREARHWTDVDQPFRMSWSPDSSRLATTNLGGHLQIFDPSPDAKEFSDWQSETQRRTWSVTWSADGSRLAVGVLEGFAVIILDATTGEIKQRLKGDIIGPSLCLAFSSDGRYLASGHSKAVQVWDTEKGESVGLIRGHVQRVKSIAWDAAGARLLTTGWADEMHWTFGPESQTTTKVWDAQIETMPSDRLGRSSLLTDAESKDRAFLGWNSNGKYFATSMSGTIEIWNSDTRQLHYPIALTTAFTGRLTARHFAWGPSGKYFAFVDGEGSVTVRESARDVVRSKFRMAASGASDGGLVTNLYRTALAWCPDGECIAVNDGEAIVIYDWLTGESMSRLPITHNPSISYLPCSIAWHPNGKDVAFWNGEEIRIWDTRKNQVLDRVKARVYFADLAWHPEGTQLAATFGNKVKTWDWDGTSLIERHELSGHSNAVVCVSWSPDGTRLLTGAQDATARLWDPMSGKETLAFYHHLSAVDAQWHPDGKRILTAEDGFHDDGWGKFIWDATKAYDE